MTQSSTKNAIVLCPKNDSNAFKILIGYQDIPKTESEFYLRFQTMDLEDIEYLKHYFNVDEQWKVFEKICIFFNVKVA